MKPVGRNDPCTCGSGRKHKHCCLGKNGSLAPIPQAERLPIAAALRSAIKHFRLGQSIEAEAICQEILGREPDNAEALHLSGVISNQRGNNALALAFIRKAITVNPAEPNYYSNLGNVLRGLGQLEEAVVSYRKALAIRPDFPEAINNLGLVLDDLGQFEEAVAAYRKTLSIWPGSAETHNNLGNTLKKLKRLDEAVLSYTEALAIKPEYAEAHCSLGSAYEERGDLDEAIASYSRALILKPDFAEAHNNLGNVFERQDKLDEAAACYNRTLTVRPDLAEPYLNLASVLMSIGRTSEAGTLLELGLARVRNGGWRLASMAATAYWIMGLYDEARVLVGNYLAAAASDALDRYSARQKAFMGYIAKLLEHRDAHLSLYASEAGTLPLAVLGDSHSLSPANTAFEWCGDRVTASSRYISGIKMFHLGESARLQYANYLSAHLRAIDPASHLLFTIGEIDCRPNEGIWTAHRRKGGSLPEIVASSVDGYLSAIAHQLAGRDFASITVQGIPASAYALTEEFDPGDKPAFLAMIGSVNQQLHSGALLRGWQFLDVYAATAGSDGVSNGKWNLDGFHLLPTFYAEAMRWLRGRTSREQVTG